MNKLVVYVDRQTAELMVNDVVLKTFKISTAKNGIGCQIGSYCTPDGALKVAEKIGDGHPVGAVFKFRRATGEVWSLDPDNPLCRSVDDLILTRILWLEGAEPKNANTRERLVYIHGTNHEDKLGTPVSVGCIRMSNADVLTVYDMLDIGSEVIVAPSGPA
ncbi:MAG: L,D-transpeptidase family protein [Oligoflexales bacterium]